MSVRKRKIDFCSANECRKKSNEDDEAVRPEFKKCSRCKLAPYCSQDCQRSDWNSHKKICVTFRA